MTDNEIIEALECCRDDERYDTCEYCLKCPVSNYNLDEETEAVNCVDALLTRAIDLIKRKDAEIERLKEDNHFHLRLEALLAEQRDGRDKLVEQIDAQNDKLRISLKTAKSEAIKDFVEKVYKMLITKENWREFKSAWLDNGECYWLKHKLRNLVKMTEQP